MKWINAEQQVTVTIYDEEHEEHLVKTMTVEEMLDSYTNEGCPTIYSNPEQPESAKEYCAECDHIEMCRWYPYEGCEFRSLPSAQPERKGMWIHERVNSEHSVTGYFILRSCECSECGAICEQESNFCPVCGSDMRGNDE